MTRERKAMIGLAALVPLIALVLWLQYRPTSELDSEAAAHPQVAQVSALRDKKDVAGLTQLARSDDLVVARRAVQAIADVGGQLDGPLSDPRTDVRLTAVAQLAATEAPIPVLSRYLKDPEPDVRITAMRGIANSRDFSMFDALVPMLNDPQLNVRRAALAAIETRVGLKFDDFDPTGSPQARGAAIARIRALLPKFRQHFETANEFERRRQAGGGT